jgi:predicted nucleotidyltransferase
LEQKLNEQRAAELAQTVCRWSERQNDILALALAGSWARGEPRSDSDLDLIVLCESPKRYRGLDAKAVFEERIVKQSFEQYGNLFSHRIHLEDGAEIELGFAAKAWACVQPLDPGSLQVVSGGFKPLADPAGLLSCFLQAIKKAAF